MRKLGLLLTIAIFSSCVFGCSTGKNNEKENDTSSTYVNENAGQGTNGESGDKTKPLAKVQVISVVPTDLFNLFCSKDANRSEPTQGYITGYTESEMLIEEIKQIEDDGLPPTVTTEWVGEKTLKLADEVEVWGLFTGTGNCYIQIPLEDIDNYEAMTNRGQWSFYENVEGKICMIVQDYLP